MDLRLAPTAMPAAMRSLATTRAQSARDSAGADTGFGDALKSALHAVSASQADATRLQHAVQLENPGVSLEDTMMAIQRAQIGFQATLHVRNRMVQAYTDIMNMQV